MTVIRVPNNEDELMGFCCSVAKFINTSEDGVSALFGNTYGKAVVHKCFFRNNSDDEELEFVVEGVDSSGNDFEWVARLSELKRVVNYGHHRGYYFSTTAMKSMVLYLD